MTTTSIGRLLIRDTYESFLRYTTFDGGFNVVVAVDPTGAVTAEERSAVIAFLHDLPSVDDRVESVTIETWDQNIGLERSLLTLLSHCRCEFGIHLEDDWRTVSEIDLNALLLDLVEQEATLIAFNNDNVAAGGTFDRAAESVPVAGTHVPLRRLTDASWAADYLPFSPHVHQNRRWIPAVVRSLMVNFDKDRCPEERIREVVATSGMRSAHNVLWTTELISLDTGRAWQATRELSKSIFGEPQEEVGWPAARAAERLRGARGRTLITASQRMIATAKGPFASVGDRLPAFATRARGARIVDADGNVYIDFVAKDGAVSLGYAHPAVTAAVRSQLDAGHCGAGWPWPESAVKAAEYVLRAYPIAELVWFAPSAADVRGMAVAAARERTGRTLVAVGIGADPVPAPAVWFDPADADGRGSLTAALGRHPGDVACVFVSPPLREPLTPQRASEIAAQARGAGALLVVDEALTGFRLALGGAQEHLGMHADLTCLSHALAAGFPLAALCGRSDLVDAAAAFAPESHGDPIALAAAEAALKHYRRSDYLERIWRLGQRLADGFNELARDAGVAPLVLGYAPVPFLRPQLAGAAASDPAALLRRMARRGVLMRVGPNFITGAHTSRDVDLAIEAASAALRETIAQQVS